MRSMENLLDIAGGVATIADDKVSRIFGITRRSRMLALNAAIESHRFGTAGRGFAVVADEVKTISGEISDLASALHKELKGGLEQLRGIAVGMADELDQVRGERLADLAHNLIEITDRNLYERSCDVRWWATDGAVVDCLTGAPDPAKCEHACHRLSVILDSYTVYLDLWVADAQGRVVASGRPGRFPRAKGLDVSKERWFRDALATRDGGAFAVADIQANDALDGAHTATYSTAIRENGDAQGRILGVLGIFFDWSGQARAIVDGVRLTPEEKARSRCLIVDSRHTVIATSDGKGVLKETFRLKSNGRERGFYATEDGLVGFALTPGYETYEGLGWYGVVELKNP